MIREWDPKDKRLTRVITIRDQFEGFHSYENAPDEVAFLRNSHRHIFKLECKIEVFHNDRELEFFMVKNILQREIIPFVTMKANLGSCEQIAERILQGLLTAYGDDRQYIITVSEDGENDGSVYWNHY